VTAAGGGMIAADPNPSGWTRGQGVGTGKMTTTGEHADPGGGIASGDQAKTSSMTGDEVASMAI